MRLRRALDLVCALVIGGCTILGAGRAATYVRSMLPSGDIITLGTTNCDEDGAHVWIRTEGMAPDEVTSTIIHEGAHVHQCRRMGSIRFTLAAMRARSSADLEAEAFSIQHRAEGLDALLCPVTVTSDLMGGYPQIAKLGQDTVFAVARTQCGRVYPSQIPKP